MSHRAVPKANAAVRSGERTFVTANASPGSNTAIQALVLHPDDNVATALTALSTGARVPLQGGEAGVSVTLREPIGLCHKFALRDIAAGDVIVKYGEAIGRATCAITCGAHVHTHNLVSARGR